MQKQTYLQGICPDGRLAACSRLVVEDGSDSIQQGVQVDLSVLVLQDKSVDGRVVEDGLPILSSIQVTTSDLHTTVTELDIDLLQKRVEGGTVTHRLVEASMISFDIIIRSQLQSILSPDRRRKHDRGYPLSAHVGEEVVQTMGPAEVVPWPFNPIKCTRNVVMGKETQCLSPGIQVLQCIHPAG